MRSLFFLFIWIVAACLPAAAHIRSGSEAIDPDAVRIPSLSHGQMGIIADHRHAIIALGKEIAFRDQTASRLVSYIHAQRMACLWGLIPGSIPDEASPFNECSHAYLAATRALLLHLATVPQTAERAGRLRDRIELDMLESGTSLQMCQYSDLAFNTGEVLYPHWADLPGHPRSLLTIAGLVLAAAIGSWSLLRSGSASRRPLRA